MAKNSLFLILALLASLPIFGCAAPDTGQPDADRQTDMSDADALALMVADVLTNPELATERDYVCPEKVKLAILVNDANSKVNWPPHFRPVVNGFRVIFMNERDLPKVNEIAYGLYLQQFDPKKSPDPFKGNALVSFFRIDNHHKLPNRLAGYLCYYECVKSEGAWKVTAMWVMSP